MKYKLIYCILFGLIISIAGADKDYEYACVGNCDNWADPKIEGNGGILLAGGGGDVDHAMTVFTEWANQGDIVVLRASGTDAYNSYLYNLSNQTVNSVSTFILHSRKACSDEFLLDRVRHANAIFWAGGNQFLYYSYAKHTPLEDAMMETILKRNCAYGGTSAGCAIASQYIYSGEFKSVTSQQALYDPYTPDVAIGTNFISIPLLKDVITDTHYSARDRAGRSMTFSARLIRDIWTENPLVVAVNERSAVMIQPDGKAYISTSNSEQGGAYFMTPSEAEPKVCEPDEYLEYSVDVWKASNNTGFVYDFSTRQAIEDGKNTIGYVLTASKGKVKSSNGNVY